MEILRIIAMLCNLQTGADYPARIEHVDKTQSKCHAYYAQCFDKKRVTQVGPHSVLMLECLKERKQ